MIDPAEHYGQIYEALDTIVEDVGELVQTEVALLKMCETAEERVIVATEVGVDKQRISERRNYVLRSVLGNTATTRTDVQTAGMEYVIQHDTPQAQLAAARRVRVYNLLLDNVRRNGDVPQYGNEISLLASGYSSKRSVEQLNVRLHGRPDPETGGTWYDLNNPRTVEYVMGGSDDKVVAKYPIKEQSTGGTGEAVIVAQTPGVGTADIVVSLTEGDRTWRVNESDQLELYIPGGSVSLSESSPRSIERQLNGTDEASRIAVQATGASIPNIIESFEHPDHANPVPVTVSKTN